MSSIEIARLAEAVAVALNAQATTDGLTTLRLYARDHLPMNTTDPFGVIDSTAVGFDWWPTLSAGVPAGPAAWMVTASSQRRDGALWVLDQVRRLVERTDPATVALTGTTRVIRMWSAGPPSPPIEVGDLVTVTETYYAPVEAT